MACEFFVVGWGLKNRKTIKEQYPVDIWPYDIPFDI